MRNAKKSTLSRPPAHAAASKIKAPKAPKAPKPRKAPKPKKTAVCARPKPIQFPNDRIGFKHQGGHSHFHVAGQPHKKLTGVHALVTLFAGEEKWDYDKATVDLSHRYPYHSQVAAPLSEAQMRVRRMATAKAGMAHGKRFDRVRDECIALFLAHPNYEQFYTSGGARLSLNKADQRFLSRNPNIFPPQVRHCFAWLERHRLRPVSGEQWCDLTHKGLALATSIDMVCLDEQNRWVAIETKCGYASDFCHGDQAGSMLHVPYACHPHTMLHRSLLQCAIGVYYGMECFTGYRPSTQHFVLQLTPRSCTAYAVPLQMLDKRIIQSFMDTCKAKFPLL
jgi:hypothetical protein